MKMRQAMREALTALEPRLVPHVTYSKGGCWTWTGGLSHDQPVYRLGPGRTVQPVRRWLYAQTREPVPPRRFVRAEPRCPLVCVNPDHAYVLPPGVRERRDISGRR